jgi:formate C-acetyltransferase
MQLQISSISREEMLDAIEHPENHKSLVVRVGGFSEYFNNLSPELK